MKYRLRSMMIVVTLVAFVLAGYGMAIRRLKERQRAIWRIEQGGGMVSFGEDRPAWIMSRIGEVFFADERALYEVKEITFLSSPETTDDDLQIVREFPSLESLQVHSSLITDCGLEALQSLPRLKALSLYRTPIRSESSLSTISNLKHLKYLLVHDSTPKHFRTDLEKVIGASGQAHQGDHGDLFIVDARGE